MRKTEMLISLALLILALLAINGLKYLSTNAHYSAYFSQQDPVMKQAQWFEQAFGLQDRLIILVRDKDSFAPQRIAEFGQLQRKLETLPFVTDIAAYYQPLKPDSTLIDESGGAPEALVEEEDGVQDILELYPDVLARREAVESNPLTQYLYSSEHHSGLIVLSVTLPMKNSVQEIRELNQQAKVVMSAELSQWSSSPQWFFSGTLALNQAYIDVVRHDLRFFIPGLLLVFSLLLYFVTASLRLTAALQFIGVLSVVLSYGLLGYLEISLTAINAFTPVIILTLTIAANMHLVLAAYARHNQGMKVSDAVAQALLQTFKPYVFSMLTTAAGFLLLLFSPSPPVKLVGAGVAVAMLFSVLLSRIVLPRLLCTVLQRKRAQPILKIQSLSSVFAGARREHGRWIMRGSFVVAVVALVAVSQLKVDDNVYEYFPQKLGFSLGLDAMEQDFGAVSEVNYALSINEGSVVSQTAVNLLTQFRQWLSQTYPDVELLDLAKVMTERGWTVEQMNQGLAQSLSFPPHLRQWLTQDLLSNRFVLRVPRKSARELLTMDLGVKHWFELHLDALNGQSRIDNGPVWRLSGGNSPDLTFAYLGSRNASNMLFSLGLALVIISLLIGAYFRSWAILGIGLLVNTFPLLLVYGIWALTGGYISLGCALVMGMVMGLIVDDTLHLFFALGKRPRQWPDIQHQVKRVMPAILLSSAIIVAGLTLGLVSEFTPIRELSGLTILSVLFALWADLILLPHLFYRYLSQANAKVMVGEHHE